MKFSEFVTNKELETEGVWVPLGEGLELKVARANTAKFANYLRKISKPYQRQIRNETIDDEIGLKLLKKAYAKLVLLDWKGLEDDDGNPIPYSEEKALELFDKSDDFFREIRELAIERDLFQNEMKADSEKN